jgi:hypothetical protein
MVLLLVAILSLSVASPAALGSSADTTPPSAPRVVYAQGDYCLTLIVGVNRSTDDQTPQSQLTYDVFADGRRIGSMGRPRQRIRRVEHPAPHPYRPQHHHRQGGRRGRQPVRTQHRPQHHERRDWLPLLTISGTFLRQLSLAKQRSKDSPDTP